MRKFFCVRAETVHYCAVIVAEDAKAAAEIAENALHCDMELRRVDGYVRLVRELKDEEMERVPRLYQTKNGYEQ